jgi:type I restriction enzyme S subunit
MSAYRPYPKYKPSGVEWLGDVPDGWEVVQLKNFVNIQNGADHKHVEQADGYPVMGSGGIFAYASEFLYDGESVLLGRKGTIDKPLHVTGRFWTVDTMYWTKINPSASGRFTYYTALTIPFGYYSTNTALPSMTKGNLASHLVAKPPLPEQHQIAAFLEATTLAGFVRQEALKLFGRPEPLPREVLAMLEPVSAAEAEAHLKARLAALLG